MHRTVRILAAFTTLFLLAAPLSAQRKKKKNEELPNQQLETLQDPASSVAAETAKLGYLYSPLTAKGLLSQQTRDAVRTLMKNSRGAHVVKLRAFVAGTGDLRRVATIVGDEFGNRRATMPALTVVLVGQLPLEGAQVLLEATVVEKKAVNPNGLAFISGQQVLREGKVENPMEPVLPLIEKSLANLKTAADASSVASMMRVTCFVSSLADHANVQRKISESFPQAANAVIQLQRGPLRPIVECEGTGRLSSGPTENVKLLNPANLLGSKSYSQVALVKSPRVLFTSSQLAFGTKEADIRLAFDRLNRVLTQANSSYKNVFLASYYPLTNPVIELIRAQRFNYFDQSRPPASTMILFEGLPSHDASFAFEVIAAVN